jgi:hypothetical protein
MHVRCVRGIPLDPVLRRVDTGARAHRACHKRGIDDRGLGFLRFQPVILDLAADLGQQIIVNPALDQGIAASDRASGQAKTPANPSAHQSSTARRHRQSDPPLRARIGPSSHLEIQHNDHNSADNRRESSIMQRSLQLIIS